MDGAERVSCFRLVCLLERDVKSLGGNQWIWVEFGEQIG